MPEQAITTPEDWRVLRALCLYRLLLAPLLAAIFLSGLAPDFLGVRAPALFQTMSYAWFAAGSLLMIGQIARGIGFERQLVLHVISDLTAIAGLMFATRGIAGGLGILLLVPILGYGLLLPPRLAALTAALATITIFGVELWLQYPDNWMASALTQTGVLGAVLFVVAIAASTVALRAQRSEARAEQAGSALLSLSRLNDTIVESMRAGVIVVDNRFRLRTLNQAAQALLPEAGPRLGADLQQVLPALANDIARWRAGQVPAAVLQLGKREVVARYSALGPEADPPVLVLLEDARRARDDAERMKLAALGRLSASIAHEIRNPLSAITQANELLEGCEAPEEAARLRAVIQRHGQRIDGIIRDVLDIGRGRPPQTESLPLGALLESTLQQFREGAAATARALDIRIRDVERLADTVVHIDREHFCRILHNLWRNSADHGARRVRVHADTTATRARLHIADDGHGIDDSLREQVFEPFFTTSTHGTGLGLYLARTLCEANGAELQLMAAGRNGGAHFILALPASIRSAA